jgi:uncharacterized protein YjlB
MKIKPEQFFVKDDGIFPNNSLPIIFYPKALDLPKLFAAIAVRKLFQKNNWGNNWKQGIYTYHHYHSITHEVLGVCKGETLLQLGGEQGITLFIEEGDVLIIPAGVAHMNLGKENDVICVGGYPNGKEGERPGTDENIGAVPLPQTDPVFGNKGAVVKIWK